MQMHRATAVMSSQPKLHACQRNWESSIVMIIVVTPARLATIMRPSAMVHGSLSLPPCLTALQQVQHPLHALLKIRTIAPVRLASIMRPSAMVHAMLSFQLRSKALEESAPLSLPPVIAANTVWKTSTICSCPFLCLPPRSGSLWVFDHEADPSKTMAQ